jgi:hypothetical protein
MRFPRHGQEGALCVGGQGIGRVTDVDVRLPGASRTSPRDGPILCAGPSPYVVSSPRAIKILPERMSSTMLKG